MQPPPNGRRAFRSGRQARDGSVTGKSVIPHSRLRCPPFLIFLLNSPSPSSPACLFSFLTSFRRPQRRPQADGAIARCLYPRPRCPDPDTLSPSIPAPAPPPATTHNVHDAVHQSADKEESRGLADAHCDVVADLVVGRRTQLRRETARGVPWWPNGPARGRLLRFSKSWYGVGYGTWD